MKKIMVLLLLILFGCEDNSPYIIGFSATLSGPNATIGVQEMYGAELAVEHINASGGINGRKVVLEIRDDFNDAQTAVEVDNELIELGAVAIIGHGFSSVAEETVKNANENDFLLISPSIGTDLMTGLKDNFIRLVPTATYEANQITNIVLESGHKNVLLVYSEDNISLTGYHKLEFERVMSENGLTPFTYGFSTNDVADYNEILSIVENEMIESMIIVGSSLDAANIIQLNKLEDQRIEYHLSAWATSGDIAQRVGYDADGITLYNFFCSDDADEYFNVVNDEFLEHYGVELSMVASYAYDSVYLLKEAIEGYKDLDTALLIERITSLGKFEGVQSEFTINQYGDVERDIYQFIIDNGEFVNRKE